MLQRWIRMMTSFLATPGREYWRGGTKRDFPRLCRRLSLLPNNMDTGCVP